MEIKLDIGKNTHELLSKYSEKDKKSYESFAIDMLEFGLRIYENALNDDGEDTKSIEYKIFEKVIENNLINQELAHYSFDRNRGSSKFHDVESVLKTCSIKAAAYIKGLKNNDL